VRSKFVVRHRCIPSIKKSKTMVSETCSIRLRSVRDRVKGFSRWINTCAISTTNQSNNQSIKPPINCAGRTGGRVQPTQWWRCGSDRIGPSHHCNADRIRRNQPIFDPVVDRLQRALEVRRILAWQVGRGRSWSWHVVLEVQLFVTQNATGDDGLAIEPKHPIQVECHDFRCSLCQEIANCHIDLVSGTTSPTDTSTEAENE
jgi:hypothetical protein